VTNCQLFGNVVDTAIIITPVSADIVSLNKSNTVEYRIAKTEIEPIAMPNNAVTTNGLLVVSVERSPAHILVRK
jgi:uncharacterized lipoprotein YbaY